MSEWETYLSLHGPQASHLEHQPCHHFCLPLDVLHYKEQGLDSCAIHHSLHFPFEGMSMQGPQNHDTQK